MTFNITKSLVDLSLRDKAQPYFHKVTSLGSPDGIVSLKEKCLSIIKSHSNLIEKLFRDHDWSNIISSSNPIFLQDLHLEIKAKYIDKEDFYKDEVKRMSYGNKQNTVALHGHSWKRMYLEEMFATLLNEAEEDVTTLFISVETFQNYIFTLQLKNFSNLSLLENTLPSLSNLTSLDLEYGRNNLSSVPLTSVHEQGRNFLGGMQISDAQSLARALNALPHLCSLSLTNSQIDDHVLFAFFEELQSSHTTRSGCLRDSLIELDLSFNRIHKDGFHQIIQYFFPSSFLEEEQDNDDDSNHQQQESVEDDDHDCATLVTFKLAGNSIGIEGARILGRTLETNTSLQQLDVRLNDLKDEGGQLILDGLHHNRTLKILNMACNSLSTKTTNSLCSLVDQDDGNQSCLALEVVDLSSNMFLDADFTSIASSVSKSSLGNLIELDLRGDYDSMTVRDAIATIETKMMYKRREGKKGQGCQYL